MEKFCNVGTVRLHFRICFTHSAIYMSKLYSSAFTEVRLLGAEYDLSWVSQFFGERNSQWSLLKNEKEAFPKTFFMATCVI